MLESLAHLALAGVTALAWLGAGAALLAPLGSTGDRALDFLNRLGAGAIAFVLLTFAAGYLGLLYTAAYLPVLAASALGGLVVAARMLRRATRPRPFGWPRWQQALLVLIALYALVDLLVTCAPISSADALAYHAAGPKLFAQDHRIEQLQWSWETYQPFSVEMLVLDGFLLWNSVQGAFAPLLLGLAGGGVVALTAYRLAGRAIAILACAVYLAQPFALWLFTSTFVEPGAAFTVALAVANVIQFTRTGRTQSLVLAGLFTGATAGMKYVAAGAAGVIAVTTLRLLRRRLDLRRVLAFVVPALAVALPWYVKNAIVTGDPAYPLIRGWPNAEASASAHQSFDNYGYGHSLLDLVLLPFRLLAAAEPFDRAEFISPLFLVFAPVALIVPRARRPTVIALAAVSAYALLWFFSVQDSRYLMLAMPVLAVVAAVGIRGLAARGRLGKFIAVGGAAGAFAVGAAVSAVYASQFVSVVVGGRQSEDAFLRKTVSYGESISWLNRNLPPGSRIALDYVFVLHSKNRALAWTSDVLPTTAGPAQTRAFFHRYRLDYALIFSGDAARRRQLTYVGASRVARLTVHAVLSRTRNTVGPAETMDVYRVATR